MTDFGTKNYGYMIVQIYKTYLVILFHLVFSSNTIQNKQYYEKHRLNEILRSFCSIYGIAYNDIN